MRAFICNPSMCALGHKQQRAAASTRLVRRVTSWLGDGLAVLVSSAAAKRSSTKGSPEATASCRCPCSCRSAAPRRTALDCTAASLGRLSSSSRQLSQSIASSKPAPLFPFSTCVPSKDTPDHHTQGKQQFQHHQVQPPAITRR
jgi:hypothetical protein